MPALRADWLPEAGSSLRPREVYLNDGRAWEARRMRDLRVDLDFAIVRPKLQLLLGAHVLVTEEDDIPLCDQQCEFVSLMVCQVFELQPDDLSADVRIQVF